jgi:hypothetical protein
MCRRRRRGRLVGKTGEQQLTVPVDVDAHDAELDEVLVVEVHARAAMPWM